MPLEFSCVCQRFSKLGVSSRKITNVMKGLSGITHRGVASAQRLSFVQTRPASTRPRESRDQQRIKLAMQYGRGVGVSRAETEAAQAEHARKRMREQLGKRTWHKGDVYTPHDLGPFEMKKAKTFRRPRRDVFDILNINPLEEWKNPAMMAEFMTSMGKIYHSEHTGLRPVNQRKIAKAIRRSIGMGFLPSVYVHPEMLRRRVVYQHR